MEFETKSEIRQIWLNTARLSLYEQLKVQMNKTVKLVTTVETKGRRVGDGEAHEASLATQRAPGQPDLTARPCLRKTPRSLSTPLLPRRFQLLVSPSEEAPPSCFLGSVTLLFIHILDVMLKPACLVHFSHRALLPGPTRGLLPPCGCAQAGAAPPTTPQRALTVSFHSKHQCHCHQHRKQPPQPPKRSNAIRLANRRLPSHPVLHHCKHGHSTVPRTQSESSR